MPQIFDPFASVNAAGGTVLNTISNVFQNVGKLNDASKQTSLISLSSPARVEPLCVVSSDCVHVDFLPDVLQSMQSLFSGYYLQAVAMTNQIAGVEVVKLLDRLNPNRRNDFVLGDVTGAVGRTAQRVGDHLMADESFKDIKHALPGSKTKAAMAIEANQADKPLQSDKPKTMDGIGGDAKQLDSNIAHITELTNLCVGKMLRVTLKQGGVSVEVPIAVRLMANQIPDKSMQLLLGGPGSEQNLVERIHQWRAGTISFMNDLILCQDLITERKKAMMKDTHGIYTEIVRRANGHKVAGYRSGAPSLASASNLYVLSTTTARAVEERLGGKLSNPQVRDKMFSAGYGMIAAVIDPEFDRVTFYHRGISASSSMGKNDLKASNKGSGPDVGDILKAYMAGNQPGF